MFGPNSTVQRKPVGGVLSTNTVLRNTYLMLSLTLIFSALMAGLAVIQNAPPVSIWLSLLVIIGFPFLLQAAKNSALGIALTFGYTGFIGWSIGPILSLYLTEFSNGSQLIMMAAGSTGLIFLALSAIALNPNRNFSSWGSFLTIGLLVAFVASLINIFFIKMPVFQLVISVVFSLISGGLIMYQTNAIVHGGERNYLVATVTLYVSIVNIFLTILQLLGAFSGNRD